MRVTNESNERDMLVTLSAENKLLNFNWNQSKDLYNIMKITVT